MKGSDQSGETERHSRADISNRPSAKTKTEQRRKSQWKGERWNRPPEFIVGDEENNFEIERRETVRASDYFPATVFGN